MEKARENETKNYMEEHEYIANKYVMKCFTVMILIFTLTFILNLLGIFVIEQSLMINAYIPSMVVYLAVFVMTRHVSLSNRKVKYFILFAISLVITIMGIFITYHVVLVPILLLLFATLYSSKSVMRYVYILTVISTIIVVYGGYYFGLCDANMVLLTSKKVQDYITGGQFVLSEVNNNPYISLMLFFVIPRCLIYISFMSVCRSIFSVIRGSIEKIKFQAKLEQKVDEQTEKIREQQVKLKSLFVKTITALSDAVDAKDRYTSGHSKRVAEYSRMIAERLGKNKEEQEEIYKAGLLHDVGKIRIPVDIINKPGKLTDEEYNIIKIHPVTGYHILRGISEDNIIAIAAKHHHERYDGKGYPNGLTGENIPEVARIIGIADAYDAMTSNRSYRSLLPQEVVRSEIEKGKGVQFDPNIADIMLQMIDEDKDYCLRQEDTWLRNILVVGNDAKNNAAIENIMNDEPMYKVMYAKNEKEAYDIVGQQYIKLVLIDAEELEKEDAYTLNLIKDVYGTPIVIMIDDNKLDVSTVLSEYRYDDYITKPFQPILVREAVHNITERTYIDNE